MKTTTDQTRVNRAIADLHPIMRAPVKGLVAATRELSWHSGTGSCHFELFEGYRSPIRQHYLFTTTKNTKARPWQSAHQYGLAVDFAVWCDQSDNASKWLWPDDAPWQDLKRLAIGFGLTVPIKWDRGHVEHPQFKLIR